MKTYIFFKARIWLFICWCVQRLGLRGKAWYKEHQSRVYHRLSYLGNLTFDYEAYGKEMLRKSKDALKDEFIPLKGGLSILAPDSPKLIAFSLPQYHPLKENNEWHGRGFTEWTNVTKAVPQFLGHHQPQLPIDVGFYDLTHPDVMCRQVELARQYGLYGFCFHYYWFSGGKRLLETPIFNWLHHKDLDFPFCLCWANENWSKLWDGGNREVLMRQECNAEDAEGFMDDILPFLKDSRYITIEGKPLLIIYRPNLFTKDNWLKFSQTIREKAMVSGLSGLYLTMVGIDYFSDKPSDWGFDALVEFPPMRITHLREYVKNNNPINPEFKGYVYSMENAINSGRIYENDTTDVPVFRGIFPRWDNTARKAYSNASVYLQSPELYQRWLTGLIEWEKKHNEVDKQFIFINAWNEWAEGAHLEPDSRYGYAYLQATLDAQRQHK